MVQDRDPQAPIFRESSRRHEYLFRARTLRSISVLSFVVGVLGLVSWCLYQLAVAAGLVGETFLPDPLADHVDFLIWASGVALLGGFVSGRVLRSRRRS